jgi:hypothetical protein
MNQTQGKEVVMQNKKFLGLGLFLVALLILSFSAAEAQKKSPLIGRDTLNFTLPSTHDRVINYAEEYYGTHHLIMTFFPAAYTPT